MPVINVKAKKESKIICTTSANTETFTSLGKEIKLSPKAHVYINKPGYKIEYFVPTAEILIGIGTDHTARLIMDAEALEALKAGNKIDITTFKDFKSKLK